MLMPRRGKKFLCELILLFLFFSHICSLRVPKPGMKVVKLGGPCYRIGVGGGAASSTIQVSWCQSIRYLYVIFANLFLFQGKNEEELDFQAVQRGDAEMEQKVNRVIRACVELGEKNPIVSIHDQVFLLFFLISWSTRF